MKKLSVSFVTGAIALVFLVVGYQTALLIHHSALAKIASDRDHPDTVWVERETPVQGSVTESSSNAGSYVSSVEQDAASSPSANRSNSHASRVGSQSVHSVSRKSGAGTKYGERLRENLPRKVESFRFDPNTVSLEDLQRLGFSTKQAQSIVNYREKGGRFKRKSDFQKSYVVSDSVYERLEPYIDIPLLDINKADSAAFDSLPGIGGYFARKMVEYRSLLGGYSYPEQLMDIYHFDQQKYDALSDLITCSEPEPYPLWTLTEDQLRRHPYIKDYATARSIVFYRQHNPPEKCTIQGLLDAGVLKAEQAAKLSRCRIVEL